MSLRIDKEDSNGVNEDKFNGEDVGQDLNVNLQKENSKDNVKRL